MNRTLAMLASIVFVIESYCALPLRANPASCHTTKIYWVDNGAGAIRCSDPDGSNTQTVLTGLSSPRGLAVDVVGQKIYWGQNGGVYRANLDGSVAGLFIGGYPGPDGISLDCASGKIYWVDGGSDDVSRANLLDGSNVEQLVDLGFPTAHPDDLAIDHDAQKIYWVDRGGGPVLQRANLDGSLVEDVITAPAFQANPVGVAVDGCGGKVYWTEGNASGSAGDTIRCANLDGTEIRDLVTTGMNEPRDISLDLSAGHVYWSDFTGRIERVDLDGSNRQVIISVPSFLWGIALVGDPVDVVDCNTNCMPDACELLDNDCNSNSVPDDCELDSDRDDVIDECDGCPSDPDKTEPGICGCGSAETGDTDGDGTPDCIDGCPDDEDKVAPGFCGCGLPEVDHGGLTSIYWVDYSAGAIRVADPDGSNTQTVLTGLSSPRGLAVDVAGQKIYWGQNGGIYRANLDGTEPGLFIGGYPGPDGISLDLSAGKIYWVDGGSDDVSRANLADGSNVEQLIDLGFPSAHPDDLAIDHDDQKIYWVDRGGGPVLQRANLDGSLVEDVITPPVFLANPVGVAVDGATSKVYWTEGNASSTEGDAIRCANFNGSGILDIVTTGMNEPRDIALDLAAGHIYWSDFTGSIERVNLDGSNRQVIKSGQPSVWGIALVGDYVDVVDCNTNDTPDACELSGNDCNTSGILDACEPDFDVDGWIDDCDNDIDGDGILNANDACNYTPMRAILEGRVINDPASSLHGTIRGDYDGDCDCDLQDYGFFQQDFTGPNM